MDQPRTITRYGLYGENLAQVSGDFVHVETIAARCSQHDWSIGAHVHPDISQVLLLGSGTGHMHADGRDHALVAPALVHVPSGVVHGFGFAQGTRGWVLSMADMLLADHRLAPFVPGPARLGASVTTLDPDRAARLDWLLSDMRDAAAISNPAALARLALILALGGEAHTLPGVGAGTVPPAGPDMLVARYRRMVDARFAERLGIAGYAAALGTTPQTLTRACRTVLQRAPGAVLAERRMLEAQRLLCYTRASVADVALASGFADPAYFARVFAAQTGTPPSRFRRVALAMQ